MKDYDFEDNNNIEKKQNKESEIRAKIKEYFSLNNSLIKQEFFNFLKYIGLDEIWTTENEQKILWDKIAMYAVDKKNIDYQAALCGISDFFEEDDEENDEINNNYDIKLNGNNNDLLLDIELQSLQMKRKSFERNENVKENDKNEIFIDEFIESLKGKEEILYGIRFINEIFFRKYLNEDNLEKNLENIDNYKNMFKINKNDILTEIKNKYKFINIPKEIIQKYFNYISKYNKNKKDEIFIEKSLIKYINLIIKNKNKENENSQNKTLIKSLNFNSINDNNDICSKVEQLISFDINTNNCIETIIIFKNNKHLIDLLKEYICKYIDKLKNSIYQEIKQKENEYKKKLLTINNYKNEDNKFCYQENKKLKRQIESLIKENLTLSKEIEYMNSKIENENNEIGNRENSKSPKIINTDNSSNLKKNKNKIVIPPLNFNRENKLNLNKNNDYMNNNLMNNSSSISKSPNKLLQTGTNSFNDINIDEFIASHIENSMNLNNITDQFLLDTTRLCNDEENNNNNDEKIINNKNNEKEKNKNNIFNYSTNMNSNKKKDSNLNNYLYSDLSEKVSRIKGEESEDNYDEYDEIDLGPIKFHKYNNHLTDRIYRNSDIQNNILNIENNNNNYSKAQSFLSPNINNNPWKKKIKFSNEDIFYGYINKATTNFYDFKYLFHIHKIQKLLYRNKEKLIYEEFLSDEINAYFLNSKKKKYILLITYHNFYLLKNDESFECSLILKIKTLESIIVSSKNFNLLYLSFNGGTEVIIESYQRIEILRFFQKIINKGIFSPNLKLSSSNNFIFHKRNGTLEQIPTIKNKMFLITPNFENAQKIGVLLKYKDSFFSASFQEKLIVLCSVGLMYFDDNYKSPKNIIPIAGTAIKFIVVQINKTIYCLKMKTINDEVYIFGSLQKREIFDWLKELALFKKVYHMKMKQINPNYINQNKNKININKKSDSNNIE